MKLQFDVNNQVDEPNIVLAKRNYNKLGSITNYEDLTYEYNLSSADALNFTVYKRDNIVNDTLSEVENLFINTITANTTDYIQLKDQTKKTDFSSTDITANSEHGYKVVGGNYPYIRFGSSNASNGSLNGLIPGTTYTLSLDLKYRVMSQYTGSGRVSVGAWYYCDSVEEGTFKYTCGADIVGAAGVETGWSHLTFTFTVPTNVTMNYLKIAPYSYTTEYMASDDYIEFRNIALYKGTTDYGYIASPVDYGYIDSSLWEEIVDRRLVWIKEFDEWFEITVETTEDESGTLRKDVTGTSLCEAELSQININGTEINTEDDIARDDYVVTKFYNTENTKASLLHRLLKKAPHYSIGEVDKTLWDIQRTFSFDSTTLYDALNEVAEEIGVLFLYDTNTRTINAYDLESNCLACGHRGEFTDVCPECGSTNIQLGYGEDTTIMVDKDSLSQTITLSSKADEYKNYFKLVAGDDLMTASVEACNPTGSQYIFAFSDEDKKDMSTELVTKLNAYDTLYNDNIAKYQEIMQKEYADIDEEMKLTSTMMPDISRAATTAAKELAKLSTGSLSPVSVLDVSKLTKYSADNAVLAMAKCIVDTSRYKITIVSSALTSQTWAGKFHIVNYSDEEDVAENETDINVTVDDDYSNYVKQKVSKTIDRDDIYLIDIFEVETDIASFKKALTEYCLNRLNSFENAYSSIIEVMVEANVADSSTYGDIYTDLYKPYYDKLKAIQAEIDVRSKEIAVVEDELEDLEEQKSDIWDMLDLETYLGSDLYKELCSFMREDTYENSNYISDGLDNTQLFDKAKEFLEVAQKEIKTASTPQWELSSTLNDFLAVKEFQPLVSYFEGGNWLRLRIDGNIYRLRLIHYVINFADLNSLDVEFSEVTVTANGLNDVNSILDQAQSMSSSFNYVAHQAKQGSDSFSTIDQIKNNGLDASLYSIRSKDNQEFVIDGHGINGREWDDIEARYNPEQIQIVNNMIAYTDDSWETAKCALGKINYYNPLYKANVSEFGLIADAVISGIVMGNDIIGGDIYSENWNIDPDIEWELGDFDFSSTSGWTKKDSTTAIRSTREWYLYADTEITLSDFDNNAYRLLYKKDDGVYEDTGMIQRRFTVEDNGYYVFVMAHVDESEIDNVQTFEKLFEIEVPTIGTHIDLNTGDFSFAGDKISYNTTDNKINMKDVVIDWSSSATPTLEELKADDDETLDSILQGISTHINTQAEYYKQDTMPFDIHPNVVTNPEYDKLTGTLWYNTSEMGYAFTYDDSDDDLPIQKILSLDPKTTYIYVKNVNEYKSTKYDYIWEKYDGEPEEIVTGIEYAIKDNYLTPAEQNNLNAIMQSIISDSLNYEKTCAEYDLLETDEYKAYTNLGLTYELGTYTSDTTTGYWIKIDNDKRIRLTNADGIYLIKGATIKLTDYDDAGFLVYYKYNDGTIGKTDWLYDTYTVETEGYYTFTVAHKDEVTLEDVEELSKLVVVTSANVGTGDYDKIYNYCFGELIVQDGVVTNGILRDNSTTITIVPDDYQTYFTNYYNTKANLDAKIAGTNKTALDSFKSDVSQAMGLGTTIIDKDSIISPKIGGGYLYLVSTDGLTSVEINPDAIDGTDATGKYETSKSVFAIKKTTTTTKDDLILGIDTDGDAYLKGKIEASSGKIADWQIGTNSIYRNYSVYGTSGGMYFGTSGLSISNKFKVSSTGVLTSGADDSDYVVLRDGGLTFYETNKAIATFTSTYWKSTPTKLGTGVHSEYNSSFVSFGNKSSSTDTSYTTSFLINYGLNPDGNEYDVISYGSFYAASKIFVAGTTYLNNPVNIYDTTTIEAALICKGSYPQIRGDGSYLHLCSGAIVNRGLVIDSSDSEYSVRPASDKAESLGNSQHYWSNVYSQTTTITSSDRNQKNTITPLDSALTQKLIMGLNPCSFKYNTNSSDRLHYGMIAQDVEDTMAEIGIANSDFGGLIKYQKKQEVETTDEDGKTTITEEPIEGEYGYALRYEEFIAPMIKVIQNQQNKIDELETRLKSLEG